VKTIILAGGYGTRLQEATADKPKPMVEIGGVPILWHIMRIYSSYGFKEFLLALGYKSEVIKMHFLNYHYLRASFSVDLRSGQLTTHDARQEDWKVHLMDTGVGTQTGGRIKRLADWVKDGTFMVTYGDGVSNVDVGKLVEFHRRHGKLATVTAVRPPSRFGGLDVADEDRVRSFTEKPQIGEGWINGGFFVLEPKVLDYIDGDAIPFDHAPLERLAAEGQLVAYKHDDFWQCMDTLRDVRLLESLWQSGKAPWKVWNDDE
jgi:glucose-1-phosphate cytidylyltransferase